MSIDISLDTVVGDVTVSSGQTGDVVAKNYYAFEDESYEFYTGDGPVHLHFIRGGEERAVLAAGEFDKAYDEVYRNFAENTFRKARVHAVVQQVLSAIKFL